MNQTAIAPAAAVDWGVIDGEPVRLFTLENDNGLMMRVTNYGATITELHVPDRNGHFADVVLGYDEISGYAGSSPYFGCIAGRNANRIDQGMFELDGKSYQLAKNDGPHHLHGGVKGFDKHVWNARVFSVPDGRAIRFGRVSPAGEEHYPGELRVSVTYTLTNSDELRVEMEATTDAPTLCDLAQHTYWNLAGHDSGTVNDHLLTIEADAYTPVDATLIPTGELRPVRGTPFDFREPKPIGRDLMRVPGGYDHNLVVRGTPGAMRPVATLRDPSSGRVMELFADQPGVQFYGGNFLDGTLRGKGGVMYERYGGLCLETQFFPNAINEPSWRAPVLRPGGLYRHTMVHRFTTDGE